MLIEKHHIIEIGLGISPQNRTKDGKNCPSLNREPGHPLLCVSGSPSDGAILCNSRSVSRIENHFPRYAVWVWYRMFPASLS